MDNIKRKQRAREYYWRNRDKLRALQRKYYILKVQKQADTAAEQARIQREKEKERIAARRRKYYQDNRYKKCYNTLNRYAFKSIERARGICPDRIDEYACLYSFEKYAESYLKKSLRMNEIYNSQGRYDDCYSAGMLAYWYSIHRCAVKQYGGEHTTAYIKKMIRIYITCALVVYSDTKNLCHENGFHEIRLDADYAANQY